MHYRLSAPKDTSKKGILTRAEKREVVLALCYFETVKFQDDKIVLDISTEDRALTAYEQLLKVDWIVPTRDGNQIELKDAPNKNYIHFVQKRLKKADVTKGIFQYLYSPFSLLVMLSKVKTQPTGEWVLETVHKQPLSDWLQNVYNINASIIDTGVSFSTEEKKKIKKIAYERLR